jgi:hypothetical protein
MMPPVVTFKLQTMHVTWLEKPDYNFKSYFKKLEETTDSKKENEKDKFHGYFWKVKHGL